MSAKYLKRFEAVFLCQHPKGPQWSAKKTAKYIKKDESFVRKWCKRYTEHKNVDDLPGRGKTKTTSKKQDKAILELFKKDPLMTLRKAKEKLAEKGINISVFTIRQRLHENNIKIRTTLSKPLLSTSHTQKRLDWATENLGRDWSDVVFSDESSFWAFQSSKRAWSAKGERVVVRTVKHPVKVHVWGCFNIRGFGHLIIFTGNLNAPKMLDIYKKGLLKSTESWFGRENRSWQLQEDNDPKHRSGLCRTWKEKNNINVMEWPSQSPDANPIENVWGLMKARLRGKDIRSAKELKSRIRKIWKNLTTDYAENLVLSMDKRCQSIIDNDGDFICY